MSYEHPLEDSSRGGSGHGRPRRSGPVCLNCRAVVTAVRWDYLLPDVPDMTPEEHQRVGDLADELFREIKRRAGNNG